MPSTNQIVVVTGANGLVGAQTCRALVERGVQVRAIVRRAQTAPPLPGLDEVVGDFTDAGFAASVLSSTDAAITTVHPMESDRATQHRIGVEGTATFARSGASAGVQRLIHVSTASVYDRSPQIGDVDEDSGLVDDDADDYSVTKRDTERSLAAVSGITRVLLRPPAILGPGPTSTWNTLRPAEIRDQQQARHAVPDQTFAWVHLNDLASLAADLAVGAIPESADPARGPVGGGCTPLTVAAAPATRRAYFQTVCDAVGVDPVWDDQPAWTGHLITDRAHRWGWEPTIGLDQALRELADGLHAG